MIREVFLMHTRKEVLKMCKAFSSPYSIERVKSRDIKERPIIKLQLALDEKVFKDLIKNIKISIAANRLTNRRESRINSFYEANSIFTAWKNLKIKPKPKREKGKSERHGLGKPNGKYLNLKTKARTISESSNKIIKRLETVIGDCQAMIFDKCEKIKKLKEELERTKGKS